MLTVFVITALVVLPIMALWVFVATRPATFRVERSAEVPAPPSEVFGYINDFHRWTDWSPWEGLDPNLRRTYSGADSGKGASYAWAGNSKAGQGRMTITESVPNEKVVIDLRFEKPFPARNTTEFHFRPTGNGTHVQWVMHGENSAMGKVMSLFGGMDRFVGKDFERGLVGLRKRAITSGAAV